MKANELKLRSQRSRTKMQKHALLYYELFQFAMEPRTYIFNVWSSITPQRFHCSKLKGSYGENQSYGRHR